ncbi:hypothetical protein SAMN05660242_1812 [Thermoanaerobacterium sp. RBIITD]|nr:hypothetical protein SAMN05660242_1812 [Thermoanaerobacterium sp. RBIITD]
MRRKSHVRFGVGEKAEITSKPDLSLPAVLSDMLGLDVPCNRINVHLTPDDVLVVSQLVGGRLPEGSTKLPDGFSFQFVKVSIL